MNRLFTVVACCSLLAACGGRPEETASPPAAAGSTTTGPAQKVTFNMSWLPQGSMVGVIVAIEKGFYREKGLEVEAVRGFGGIRTTNEIDQGMFDFGYADPVSVVLNRANGGTARLVGIINDSWPAGLCYLAEKRQIRTPADLKGLMVGGGQNSAVQALLPRWLESNGVAPSDVRILQLNPSVIVASLIEGKIAAAECWRGNSRPLFVKEAKAAGFTLEWLEYAQHKLDIHGAGIATTDRTIAAKPEVVRGFVSATFRGYEYARQNPKEALDIMLARYPMLDAGVTADQIAEIAQIMTATSRAGRIDADKMTRTVDFIAGAYAVEKRPTAGDVYTNDFLAP